MWLYCGITSRTAVSVLAQYVNTIASGRAIPQLIRSDRGAETTMAADAHYQLSQKTRESLDELPFGQCYKYGTSKENARVESWWGQMCKSSIGRWRDAFQQLSRHGQYDDDLVIDRIAFLAVYIPIIR